MSHFAAGIVVFELQPYWEAELKRAFQATGVAVCAVRSAGDWYDWLAARPDSVGLWSLQGHPASCLHVTARVLETRLPVFLGVISPSSWYDLEWPLRELGVEQFWREGAIGEGSTRERVILWCERCLGSKAVASLPASRTKDAASGSL